MLINANTCTSPHTHYHSLTPHHAQLYVVMGTHETGAFIHLADKPSETLFVGLFVCLFVCLFVGLFVGLFVCLFVGWFVCLLVYWFVCWFVCLFVCWFVGLGTTQCSSCVWYNGLHPHASSFALLSSPLLSSTSLDESRGNLYTSDTTGSKFSVSLRNHLVCTL